MRGVLAAAATADLAACAVAGPSAVGTLTHLATVFARLGDESPDAALLAPLGCALWLLGLWAGAGLLAAYACALPGRAGRGAARAGRVLLPRTLRTVLAGSAGLGVLIAPVAAGASGIGAGDRVAAQHGATVVRVQAQTGAAPRTPRAPRTPAPPVTSSHTPAPPHSPPRTPAPPHTPEPPHTPAPPHGDGPRHTPGPPHSGRTGTGRHGGVPTPSRHTVRPGDSLWLLAERRLGPHTSPARVAAYWPRIYSANRAVIGDDPNLITPGQQLRLPGPASHAEQEPSP